MNGNLNLSRAIGDFEYKNQMMSPQDQVISVVPDISVRVRL